MPRGRILVAAVLVVSGLTGGTAGAQSEGGHRPDLTVATYNIHAGAGEDSVFDLDRTAAALREMHADVIGLQEVDVHWGARSDFVDEARRLAHALHMHVFYAPIYDLPSLTAGAPDRLFGVAVLSRFPIVHAVNHEITRLSTQVPNPVPAPAPGLPEVVISVRGVLLHVYDTHLDYRPDPGVRATQVDDMLEIIGPHPRHTVLLGDLNATPTAPELAPLWTDLVDVVAKTPNSGLLTYPAITPTARDDYVVVSPDFGVSNAFVADIEIVGTQASDHRPVVARLTPRRS